MVSYVRLPVIIVLLGFVINLGFRKEFPVHENGGVIITGASSGIGLHAAEHLAQSGYHVYATVRKPSDAEKLRALGLPLLKPIMMDVTKIETIDESFEVISADLAENQLNLVGLVNNAGAPSNFITEMIDVSDARDNFEVNFFGVLAVTKKFLPLLRKTGSGARIVMVSSVAGLIATPAGNPYSATKFALEAMSEALRYEVAHVGISVSVINPAFVKTEIFKKYDEQVGDTKSKYTPEQLRLYDRFVGEEYAEKIHGYQLKGDSPVVTTTAIAEAISSRYPKVRYIVANIDGIPAWVFAYMKWFLPERLVEKIVLAF